MMIVNKISYESYHEVCRVLGLLQDDNEWDEALTEGSLTKMSSALRELFITIVIFCQPASPKDLFDRHYIEWADDFLATASKKGINLSEAQTKTLVTLDIQQRLQSWNKELKILNIDEPTEQELADVAFTRENIHPVLIREELDFDIDKLQQVVLERKSKFTDSQKMVFDKALKVGLLKSFFLVKVSYFCVLHPMLAEITSFFELF